VLEAREEQERELSAVLAELAAEADSGDDRVTAIRWSRRRLALDRLSEEAARDLMRLLAGAGDRAGVLAGRAGDQSASWSIATATASRNVSSSPAAISIP
jgi:two-component SAPR family response regulator